MEFAAYNLLCVIMHSNNNRDLVSSMSRSVMVKKDEFAFLSEFCKLTCAFCHGEYVLYVVYAVEIASKILFAVFQLMFFFSIHKFL